MKFNEQVNYLTFEEKEEYFSHISYLSGVCNLSEENKMILIRSGKNCNLSEENKMILIRSGKNFNITDIDNSSEEVKLELVKKYGWTIRYIKNPSEEMQLAAVKDIGWALEYIENPSEEVQLAAIEQSEKEIVFIHNPTKSVINYAIRNFNDRALLLATLVSANIDYESLSDDLKLILELKFL